MTALFGDENFAHPRENFENRLGGGMKSPRDENTDCVAKMTSVSAKYWSQQVFQNYSQNVQKDSDLTELPQFPKKCMYHFIKYTSNCIFKYKGDGSEV